MEGVSSHVKKVFSTSISFTFLKNDGSVIFWGNDYGPQDLQLPPGTTVITNKFEYAALIPGGTVVTWGLSRGGGNKSDFKSKLVNVRKLFATEEAFAALKKDGSVITWGAIGENVTRSELELSLGSGVRSIVTTAHAFAALKEDGSVVSWGILDTHDRKLPHLPATLSSGIVDIVSTPFIFVALKKDGTVFGWPYLEPSTTVLLESLKGIKRISSVGHGVVFENKTQTDQASSVSHV